MKNLKFRVRFLIIVITLSCLNMINVYAVAYNKKEAVIPQISQKFLDYQNRVKSTAFKDNKKFKVSGYIPEPYPLPYIERKIETDFPDTYGLEGLSYNTEIPKKFISPIKDQGEDGVCWAFAANAVLESSLLKRDNSSKLDKYDFSENHMKHALSYEGENKLGFDRLHDEGGNFNQALAYWTRDKINGPILESSDPYKYGDDIRDINKTNSFVPENYYITREIELPALPSNATLTQKENRIKEIKKAIINYGSVATSYYSNDDYYDNYFEPTSYYNGDIMGTNHAVSIVGWDDNYSKSNFKQKPSRDGAFLIKNSWGIKGPLEGYFYMSYEDNCIYSSVNAIGSVNSKDFYDNIYEYDIFGRTGTTWYENEPNVAYANIFDTKTLAEQLTAVSTYVTIPDTYFKVYVSIDGSPENLKEVEISNAGIKTERGYKLDEAGYATFIIKKPINLINSKFEIAIEMYNDSVEALYIPVESSIPNYSSQAVNSKKSFIVWSSEFINEPEAWQLKDKADVCIKAFIKSIESSKYKINIAQIKGGSISVSTNLAKEGDLINVGVNPDIGMKFKEGSLKYNDGTDHIIENYKFTMPAKDVIVSAEFEPIKYNINIGVFENGNILSNKSSACECEKVELVVTSNNGKSRLKTGTLKYNGNSISTRNKNVFSFKMPQEPVNITAEFENFDIEVNYIADVTIKTLSEDLDIPEANISTIFYTTDGTNPNESNTAKSFEGIFNFQLGNRNEQILKIRAIAKRDGMEPSDETEVLVAFSNGDAGIYFPNSLLKSENIWHSKLEIESLKEAIEKAGAVQKGDSSVAQLVNAITDISNSIRNFYKLNSPEITVKQAN